MFANHLQMKLLFAGKCPAAGPQPTTSLFDKTSIFVVYDNHVVVTEVLAESNIFSLLDVRTDNLITDISQASLS